MNNFIDKTLYEINRIVKDFLFFEVVETPDFWKDVKDDIKIVILILSLIGVSFIHNLCFLLLAYFLLLIFAYLLKIDLRKFMKSSFSFVLFFTVLIVIPYLFFNPETLNIGYSHKGLYVALRLIFRVLISISLANILFFTTPWINIVKGLRMLGVPSLAIAIIYMTYRYIFFFANLAQDIFLAKKSRTIEFNYKREYSFIGSAIGLLFMKARMLSEEVSQGMISRGFGKEFHPIIKREKYTIKDFLPIIMEILIIGVLIWMDRKFYLN
ncbi:MAG: cobalt ECF transporter T component CbiQ [Dictyoglomus turgidum]|uniref:cobalt ECF transporter T component CbiQ n=1 Tax=Dictyoglomus turgidum TaxID=513050 RepID=UPI003C746830